MAMAKHSFIHDGTREMSSHEGLRGDLVEGG